MIESQEQPSTESLNTALEAIGDTPMPESAATPAAETQAQPAQSDWRGEDWKFNWGGKEIVPDSRDKVMTWASQGYNYSQRMGELNKTHAQRMAEAEQAAQKARELEQRYTPFAKVDEYARQNPEWWEHVQKSFETRQIPQNLDPQLAQIITPLTEKVGQLESFIQTQQQLAEQARVAAEQKQQDEALDAEIGEIRKQYPNIDLSAVDQSSGESVELQVLKHCAKIGTNSFKAGFRDLFFDQLTTQQQAQSLQQQAKAKQAQAKAGTTVTAAPVRELKPNPGRQGWNNPALSVDAVLAEWNQTHAQGG